MTSGTACALRIIRHSGYADLLRSYEIIVNGTRVGRLPRESVLELEVPCGPVTIEARLDWGRSRPLRIEAAPGKTIEVEVSNTWGALLALWGATFGFRSYLTVKQLNSPTSDSVG
jgi:hypothetical protein